MGTAHILIVGADASGRAYANRFAAEGVTLSVVEARSQALRRIIAELRVEGCFESIEQGLHVAAKDLSGVVVASAPATRVTDTLAVLAARLPVLLVPPVATGLADAERIEAAATATPVLVGYAWRWSAAALRVRDLMGEVVAAPRDAEVTLPGRDEAVDLALWLLGSTASVRSEGRRLLLDYPHGPRVTAGEGAPSLRVSGDAGSLEWDSVSDDVRVVRRGARSYERCLAGDPIAAVAREFLQVCAGAQPSCTVTDALRVERLLASAPTPAA